MHQNFIVMRCSLLRASLALILSGFCISSLAAPPTQTKQTAFEKKCRAFIKSKGQGAESKRLAELFDVHWKHLMTTYPEFATYIGYPGQDGRWTDGSLEAYATRDREELCAVEMAESINAAKLKGSDRLNYDLFLKRVRDNVEEAKFPGKYLQVNQLGGVQKDIAEIFEVMPRKTEKDYAAIMSRLRGAGTVIDDSMLLLKKGIEEKVTAPKITLRDVPTQIASMITEDPLESPMLLPFKEMPDEMSAVRKTELREQAKKVYVAEIKPRLVNFKKFIEETYIPAARETVAWKDLPNGEAWYAFKAKESTTTDLAPKQIHEIGLSEVARIRGEMQKVAKESGFKGGLDKFEKFLRTDKQFFFDNPDDLMREYRSIAKRVDPELVKLFGKLPRLPYGVVPVPSYSEKSQTTAYYMGGSLQSGRPGYFYANTYNLRARPKWEMEALTLHEAVPGHHLQIALAQEMESAPEFKKHFDYTAFVEGWGLYSESLGYEMGFYKDPYSRYGQLAYEMWRACRLVVDTGMHHLGWSRQQAIDYMKSNMAKTEHDITVEVDRYIVWAGQALAYKVGQMKIKELRERATHELGDRFDVRKFHDVLLGNGALPLGLLEKQVDAWIASEKKKIHQGEARPAAAKDDSRG